MCSLPFSWGDVLVAYSSLTLSLPTDGFGEVQNRVSGDCAGMRKAGRRCWRRPIC
jgi:hypothetical protein